MIDVNKLSQAQRRVAVERALKKSSNAYQGNPQPAPGGMASGIASARMPQSQLQPLPMTQSGPSLEQPPMEQSNAPMEGLIGDTSTPQPPSELSVVDQQIQAALIADQLWKDQGGDESLGGQVWSAYKSKSSEASHLDSPRDYFISRFVKWKMDPEGFKRTHMDEARVLMAINDEFEAAQGGGFG